MLLGQFRDCLKPEPSVPSITVFPFAADNGKPMTRVFLTDIMENVENNAENMMEI